MRYVFCITSLFTLLIACSADPKSGTVSGQKKTETLSSRNFRKHFADVDTSQNQTCIACSGTAYKLVGDSYVLTIRSAMPRLPDLQLLTIDGRNSRFVELQVFAPGSANLTNVCSDIITLTNGNEPVKPVAFLHPESGELVAEVVESQTPIGTDTHYTFLVKKLVFRDKGGKKIVLENELFWKVRDLGTPG